MDDKLKPYYSYEKVENSKIDILLRIFIVLLISSSVYFSSKSKDELHFIKEKIIESNWEIVAWGTNFVKFDNTGKIKKKVGISYEDLLKLD